VGDIISARDPMSWTGSRIPPLEAVRQQFAEWCDDKDATLAAVGQQAMARFDRLIENERQRETLEDDDWRWVKPGLRVS
jgi:hypothetical protein